MNQYINQILLNSGRYMTVKEIVDAINKQYTHIHATRNMVRYYLEMSKSPYDRIIINAHCYKYGLP